MHSQSEKEISANEIPILYEDAEVLVLNKPSGLSVHADLKHERATLADWILKHYPALVEVGESGMLSDGSSIIRPGIVHRLDRDTSGVIIVAKTQPAFEFLKNEFKERRVKKIYRAFIYGKLPNRQGTIDKPIGKSRKEFPLWSAEQDARGTLREALTEYRVLAETPEVSSVEIFPHTGRTHQIRVHFKALRHPILCDPLYAPKRPCLLGFDRLALHALSLELALPSGTRSIFETPLPPDFVRAEELLAST